MNLKKNFLLFSSPDFYVSNQSSPINGLSVLLTKKSNSILGNKTVLLPKIYSRFNQIGFFLNRRFLNNYFSRLKKLFSRSEKVFFNELELIGLGYRFSLKKNKVRLNLGFSHVIFVPIPAGIFFIKRKYKILIYSYNRPLLGLFTSILLKFKRLNPYKLKGLKKRSVVYKLKPGKRSK